MYLNEFRDGHGTIRIRFLFENVTFNFLIAEYAPLLSSLRNVILIIISQGRNINHVEQFVFESIHSNDKI